MYLFRPYFVYETILFLNETSGIKVTNNFLFLMDSSYFLHIFYQRSKPIYYMRFRLPLPYFLQSPRALLPTQARLFFDWTMLLLYGV